MESQIAVQSSHPRVKALPAVLLAAIIAFLLGTIAAFVSKAFADSPKGHVIVVNMNDKEPYYQPAKITVKPGDTVEWKNDGQSVHSVSTAADNAQNPKDASMPAGATAFDSGFVPPGGSFSYTFNVPGSYKYFCLPHEKAGMIGFVTVKK